MSYNASYTANDAVDCENYATLFASWLADEGDYPGSAPHGYFDSFLTRNRFAPDPRHYRERIRRTQHAAEPAYPQYNAPIDTAVPGQTGSGFLAGPGVSMNMPATTFDGLIRALRGPTNNYRGGFNNGRFRGRGYRPYGGPRRFHGYIGPRRNEQGLLSDRISAQTIANGQPNKAIRGHKASSRNTIASGKNHKQQDQVVVERDKDMDEFLADDGEREEFEQGSSGGNDKDSDAWGQGDGRM